MMRYDPAAELRERADKLDKAAPEFGERAAALFAPVAAALRDGADLYRIDPTLDGDPTGRYRDLDVMAELARQLPPLTWQALRPPPSHVVPPEGAAQWQAERWDEAEALAARVPELLAAARAKARADHAEPDGSRAISRAWLTVALPKVADAVQDALAALAKPLSLPHRDPDAAALAVQLAAVSDRIRELDAQLDTEQVVQQPARQGDGAAEGPAAPGDPGAVW